MFVFQSEILHAIKSPKEIAKVVDAEWAGSDRPLVVTASGCVHVFDISLKNASSSTDQWDLTGQCPSKADGNIANPG